MYLLVQLNHMLFHFWVAVKLVKRVIEWRGETLVFLVVEADNLVLIIVVAKFIGGQNLECLIVDAIINVAYINLSLIL